MNEEGTRKEQGRNDQEPKKLRANSFLDYNFALNVICVLSLCKNS